MSFGFSVGDFAALGQLAWKIYKACIDAPESFKNISQEVSSLLLVLKQLEEWYSDATLSTAQQSDLKYVGDGCRAVLEDLQCILDKYNSLGTKTKLTWDRLGWGSKDISELRSRLISNTVLLTAFINTSQVIVQKKLEVFLQEFREGKRGSTQTIDSLSTDERRAWRAIRKELEDIGISIEAFDSNKDFIMNYLKTSISTGAYEEQSAEDGSSSILCEDDLRQCSEDLRHDTVSCQPLKNPGHDTNSTSTSIDLQVLKLSPEAKIQKRWPPRIASLTNWQFRYNEGLLKAIQSGDEMKVQQLLDKGAKTNVIDDDGSTPLHHAVSLQSEVMVRLLLGNGAYIDAENYSEATALHTAASRGPETVVQLLLKSGANIDKKDENGFTALHLAAYSGLETVVQLLLENKPYIDAKNYREATALHTAASRGHETVVQLLVKNGVDIDGKDWQGNTALHGAANFGHETVVQLLLENGAKINEKDRYGYTALYWATISNHWTVVQLLQKHGAHLKQQGYTALHWAATPEH